MAYKSVCHIVIIILFAVAVSPFCYGLKGAASHGVFSPIVHSPSDDTAAADEPCWFTHAHVIDYHPQSLLSFVIFFSITTALFWATVMRWRDILRPAYRSEDPPGRSPPDLLPLLQVFRI